MLHTDGIGEHHLAIRDLLRDDRRHAVKVGVVLGDGRRVGNSRLGKVRVVRRVRGRTRGLGMKGLHGDEGLLGRDKEVDLRNLLRHPGGWHGHGHGQGSLGEPRALQDQLAQLRDSDPFGRVAFKHPAEDVDHLRGQGQDSLQEEGILQVGPECGILERGTLPWVATAGQVDKHDAQAPDVIGRRCVARHGAGVCLLTFWGIR